MDNLPWVSRRLEDHKEPQMRLKESAGHLPEILEFVFHAGNI